MRCKTFTCGFPGLLLLEQREHPIYGWGHFGYLSVHLGNGKYRHVERWSFDGSKVTEAELRTGLENEVPH
jgi:hypothetical protein